MAAGTSQHIQELDDEGFKPEGIIVDMESDEVGRKRRRENNAGLENISNGPRSAVARINYTTISRQGVSFF